MAVLSLLARIKDCTTGTVLAASAHLLNYQLDWTLDRPGAVVLTIPAGDPGDGTGTDGFAQALLLAASDTTGASPVPLLLEISLDGGTAYDGRRLVTGPIRRLEPRGRTIEESGPDFLSQALTYATIERATYANMALADVLFDCAGTIIPLSDAAGMLSAGEGVPGLSGVLVVDWAHQPGMESWDTSIITMLGLIGGGVNPAVSGTATYLDINADTVLGTLQTLANRLAGAAPDQDFGHFVLDSSDAALNLTSSTSFSMVPAPMTVTVGHKGTAPHLTFATASPVDTAEDPAIARLYMDSAQLVTDDSLLFPAANFVGGASSAGFPQNSRLSALGLLNPAPPSMSDGRAQWYDALPIVGLAVDDTVGFLGFSILDGQVRPWPGSPNAPILSFVFDPGHHTTPTRDAGAYVGTPRGVYYTHSDGSDPLVPGATAWLHLEGLEQPVTRLAVNSDPDDEAHNILWAQVAGADKEAWDGIYRYSVAAGWQPVMTVPKIVAWETTDFRTFWVILQKTPTKIHRYGVGNSEQTAEYTVPNGRIYDLQRVITRTHDLTPAADSLWCLVDAGVQPAYYLTRSGTDDWPDPSLGAAAWSNPNIDSSMVRPDGLPLHVYCVSSCGVTMDQPSSGPIPNILMGTDYGLWFSVANLGDPLHWHVADLAGLTNVGIRRIACPEAKTVLGQYQNRLYCCDENDLFYSCDAGRTWQGIKAEGTTSMGVHLSSIVQRLSSDLPNETLVTWGTKNLDGSDMTASPLGLASDTHYRIPAGDTDALPDGSFIQRMLTARGTYTYRLRSLGCHLPGTDHAALPQLESVADVPADIASATVITAAKRFLGQHQSPRTELTVQSSFTDDGHALRTLRPSHMVHVSGAVQVRDFDGMGTLRTTHIVNFSETPLYVIKHTISRGPGHEALTETVLAPRLLASPLTESEIAGALDDQVRQMRLPTRH